MKRQVWLSLGSNIDREEHILKAVNYLSQLFTKMTVSKIYESESVGFEGDRFYNLVVGFETAISLKRLNKIFRQIEDDHGRIRGGDKFSARTLDIDILTFGDWVCTDGEWDIPRQEITRYAFVLLPLSELAPDELHPVLEKSYAQLWREFDCSKQKLWVIEF